MIYVRVRMGIQGLREGRKRGTSRASGPNKEQIARFGPGPCPSPGHCKVLHRSPRFPDAGVTSPYSLRDRSLTGAQPSFWIQHFHQPIMLAKSVTSLRVSLHSRQVHRVLSAAQSAHICPTSNRAVMATGQHRMLVPT